MTTDTKDGDRRQCKGRRVCLGGKICSISCRTSCFASVDLEETVEEIEQMLPPKQTRRPLPLLLPPSFFYVTTPSLC